MHNITLNHGEFTNIINNSSTYQMLTALAKYTSSNKKLIK